MLFVRKYAASILLVLVALHHVDRVRHENLSTWKGGGFGMFASLDQQRFAKVYVSKGTQFFPVHGPSHTKGVRLYRQALAIPSRQRASELAHEIDRFLNLPNDRQAVVATFQVHYESSVPPRLHADSIHMVSSKPTLAGKGLKWRW